MSIRMQADDFFNAYRVLKESDEVMIEKLEKLKGKPLISKTAFGAFPTSSPSIVCLAFSVELYIKDVYCGLNIKVPRGKGGHNILELYRKLPRRIKREIFSHDSIIQNPFILRGPAGLIGKFSGVSRDYYGFVRCLETISKSFENWRYAHEHKALHYDTSFALALIEALKAISDKIRSRPAA